MPLGTAPGRRFPFIASSRSPAFGPPCQRPDVPATALTVFVLPPPLSVARDSRLPAKIGLGCCPALLIILPAPTIPATLFELTPVFALGGMRALRGGDLEFSLAELLAGSGAYFSGIPPTGGEALESGSAAYLGRYDVGDIRCYT